jgi:hypothetical protein
VCVCVCVCTRVLEESLTREAWCSAARSLAAALASTSHHLLATGSAGGVQLGEAETLLMARSEVMKAVCIRAQRQREEMAGGGGGTLIAVGTSKCIRETVCRSGTASLAMSLANGLQATAPASPNTGGKNLDAARGRGGGSGGAGIPVSREVEKRLGTAVTAVEGLIEGVWDSIANSKPAGILTAAAAGGVGGGVWDSLSTGADQVLRFGAEDTAPIAVRGEGGGGGGSGSSARGADSSLPSSQGAQALAAHPSLPMFVSGGADGVIQFWSFGAPRPLATLAAPVAAAVTRLAFDCNGHLLAVAGASGVCAVYDVASACAGSDARQRPLVVLEAHEKKALDLVFLPCGSTLLVSAGGEELSDISM